MKNLDIQMRRPTVFISSICHDLMQIREDMSEFIENELGYEALLSEKNVFPICSDLNTIDNCVRTVEERADLFILIIGGRSGHVVGDTEISITNLEYKAARKKGIPTYVFVEERIISLAPIWRRNPNGDFSDVVDSNKVFELVEDLSAEGKNWIFKFKNIQEIIEKVRAQFAFFVNDGLEFKRKFFGTEISQKISKYSGKVFRIAIEKPQAWEYLLFLEALAYNLQQQQDLKYDLQYGIYLNESVLLKEPQKILELCQIKLNELQKKTDLLNILMNQGLNEAIGKPGVPGDADYILYIAERVVDIYKTVGEWRLDFKKYMVPETFQNLLEVMSRWGSSINEGIEKFISESRVTLVAALTEEKPGTIHLTMQITLDDELTEAVNKEFERLAAIFG